MTDVRDLAARVGDELGVSDWILVDQPMIDRFADATGDHQFIHVDPEQASRTPFGGTIAHGFLLLSLMPKFLKTARALEIEGKRMGINYGGNKVRFLTPVRSGSRVRGRFRLLEVFEKQPGQWQLTLEYTVQLESSDKPALVAEWVSQIMV